MNIIIKWFKNINPVVGSIAAVIAIAGVWFGPNLVSNHTSQSGSVTIISPSDHATVSDIHIGDTIQNYGYDDDKVAKLAAKLAAEFRTEDAENIKQLEETIKALRDQNADRHDIKKALDLLSQGQTTAAEEVFESIALEERQKGEKARQNEATALRHIGSLAYLHDTQKALKAYKRSTELDPDNKVGWNQLGHLYHRIGEIENAENAYMTILKKLAGTKQEYQAIAYGNLGLVYQTRGELDKAVEFLERSLALFTEIGAASQIAQVQALLDEITPHEDSQ